MKATIRKIGLLLTLAATTVAINASPVEEQSNSTFNNSVSNQVVEHADLNIDKFASILKDPTRETLELLLGKKVKIFKTNETETWYYGINMAVSPTAKEKCVMAVLFDNNSTQPQANIISFDSFECEQAVEKMQATLIKEL